MKNVGQNLKICRKWELNPGQCGHKQALKNNNHKCCGQELNRGHQGHKQAHEIIKFTSVMPGNRTEVSEVKQSA